MDVMVRSPDLEVIRYENPFARRLCEAGFLPSLRRASCLAEVKGLLEQQDSVWLLRVDNVVHRKNAGDQDKGIITVSDVDNSGNSLDVRLPSWWSWLAVCLSAELSWDHGWFGVQNWSEAKEPWQGAVVIRLVPPAGCNGSNNCRNVLLAVRARISPDLRE